MYNIIRAIKSLMPNGRAFNITDPSKYLRKFWNAIANTGEDFVTYADEQFWDLSPQTTRELERWEEAFSLPTSGLTEQQRRDNLAAAWKETGGQTKAYIQGALQAKGFDVYVYDWWDGAVTRDPNDAEYVLKNKITFSQVTEDFSAGSEIAEAGAPEAEAGFSGAVNIGIEPSDIPSDPEKWKNFIYICGSSFGNIVSLPENRRDEFEALVLKLRPLEKWIGFYIQYIPGPA